MVSQIRAWEPQADGPGGFADEAALVAGLRAARPQAFEALHAAYAGPIYNLALRIVDDPHEAQDVAQEVLIKVLRGLPQGEEELRLPAWLYRVTVNAAFDHVRARRRRPATVTDGAAPEAAAAVDEYERVELARRVESTLRGLPKRQQLALVLRDVHGLSVGETAAALGVTKGSADVLLSRARAGFRKVYLAAERPAGRCAEADLLLAGGVGGGISAADRDALQRHAKDCPDCRRTARLWGVAPVGLGLLLPQVALPSGLSLGATLAAAQAAGVALPAGFAATAAAGAATSAAGSGAAASAAAASAAAPVAATAGGGVLAALGSAAGIKVATIAAVATAAVGMAGVAAHERTATRQPPAVAAAAARADDGMPGGSGDGARARQLARAHRPGAVGAGAGPWGATSERAGRRLESSRTGGSAGEGPAGGSQTGGQGGSAMSGGSEGGGAAGGGMDASTPGGDGASAGSGSGGPSSGSMGGDGSGGWQSSGSGGGTGGQSSGG
jgi:RNA polymerase sigma factor (sigma-70 family)